MRTAPRPATGLYGRDGCRKYLTQGERQRLMRAAWLHPDPSAGTFLLVLAYCGCRISEALALRSRDIDAEDGLIAFRSLKKRGESVVREVPIPRYLAAAISAVHGTVDADARLWPWSRSCGWRLVKTVMLAIPIAPGAHQTAKGLRHAFAIHAIRSGVPLNMVQRWLGHASIETTSIYTQALGVEERALAERMWSE